MIDGRHEHQEAPGHGDVRGQPRALGAERLLDHLDDDLLAFLEQLLDLLGGTILAIALAAAAAATAAVVAAAGLVLLVAGELVELGEGVHHVGDVEEAVALEAEVDERGLHAGQHFRDPALVDVADHAAVALALDEDLRDQVVLEDGHHGLVAVRGDDHLLIHHESPATLWSRVSS